MAEVLINADRELAAMSCDDSKKSFDSRHVTEALNAADAVRSARRDGRVFAADAVSAEAGDFTKENALRLLRDDLLNHYERVHGTGFFPRQYLEKARMAAEDAALRGRFSHVRSSCAISHVILAGELSLLSN